MRMPIPLFNFENRLDFSTLLPGEVFHSCGLGSSPGHFDDTGGLGFSGYCRAVENLFRLFANFIFHLFIRFLRFCELNVLILPWKIPSVIKDSNEVVSSKDLDWASFSRRIFSMASINFSQGGLAFSGCPDILFDRDKTAVGWLFFKTIYSTVILCDIIEDFCQLFPGWKSEMGINFSVILANAKPIRKTSFHLYKYYMIH